MAAPPSTLFETIHNSIADILTLRKRGTRNSEQTIIPQLIRVIEYGKLHSVEEEIRTSGGAILLASKLLLADVNDCEKMEVLKLLDVAIDLVERPQNLPSLSASSILPIYMNLNFNVDESPSLNRILDLFQKLLEFAGKSNKILLELYDPKNLVLISKLVTESLNIIEQRSRDFKIRIAAIIFLRTLIISCPLENLNTICTIIPGVFSKLYKIVADADNSEICSEALMLFTKSTTKCLSDDCIHKSLKELKVPEKLKSIIVRSDDEAWRKMASENVQKYITQMCSKLLSRYQLNIKKTVLEMFREIQTQCKNAFDKLLFPSIIDSCLILHQDEIMRHDVVQLMESLNDNYYVEKRLYQKLDETTAKLSSSTKERNTSQMLKILNSLVELLGSSLKYMCMSRSPTILALIRTLIDCVRIDFSRITITRDEPASSIPEQLQRFSLKSNVNHSDLRIICEKLQLISCSDIVDIIYDEMIDVSNDVKCSCIILLNYMISSDDWDGMDESVYLSISDYYTDLVEKCFDRELKSDESVEGELTENRKKECLEALLCIGIGGIIRRVKDEGRKSRKLIETLFTLLLECSSPAWIVVDSAEFGLSLIRKNLNMETQAEIMSKYGGHIVHRVYIASTSQFDHHFANPVFQGFLDRCEDESMFEKCSEISNKLMTALDMYEQKHSFRILKALLSFTRAVNRWYPDNVPLVIVAEDKEIDEEKLEPTPQMKIIEKVLKRSKMLLHSEYLPIRVICIEIARECIHFVRNFDDILLPMIHQNWQSLMTIARDNNMVAHSAVLELVLKMAQTGKSFVRKRICEEYFPIARKLALTEIRNRNSYSQTASFKFSYRFIEIIGEICKFTEMSYDEMQTVEEVLRTAEQDGCHSEIRKIAKQKLEVYW